MISKLMIFDEKREQVFEKKERVKEKGAEQGRGN